MRTQIRQEIGIATNLEPNGKIVGSSVTALRDVISPQIENCRYASYPHQLWESQQDRRLRTCCPDGGTCYGITKAGTYWGHQCWKTHQRLGGCESDRESV